MKQTAPRLDFSHAEPFAPQRPHWHRLHNTQRLDPYFWLNSRDDAEVIRYLDAENAYCEQAFAPAAGFIDQIFQEMKDRVPGEDSSVPVRRGEWFYYVRYVEGNEFPLYCRKKGSVDAAEEIMLDCNRAAEGFSFFQVGQVAVSDDGRFLCWTRDSVGRNQFEALIVDLQSGEQIEAELKGLSDDICWSRSGEFFYFVRNDEQTLRAFQVCRASRLCPKAYEVVFEEADVSCHVSLGRSRCRAYIELYVQSTTVSETLFVDADGAGTANPIPVVPRQKDHLYDVVSAGSGEVFLRSNLYSQDFRLVKCQLADAGDPNTWREVIPHRPGELLVDFEVFDNHIVVLHRKNGIDHAAFYDRQGKNHRDLRFDETAYCLSFGQNPEFDAPFVRFNYSSMTTPQTTLDVSLDDLIREVKRVQHVGGGFDASLYASEQIYVRARDGVAVAVSILYRRDLYTRDGRCPVLLYGYGSYGISIPPSFSSSRLSLVDRGFAFAIAHVRGCETFGRGWYEDGKLLKKWNTFSDFIDCAEHLIEHRYARSDGLYAMGGSAGGLLMGVVINARPDLFRGVVAAVPFVDIVTTMLDDTIPLTTFEYEEWGNPAHEEYFQYMLSYSPYDNIRQQVYPALFVTSGFHDGQVQYWEPAKWVAKLRSLRSEKSPLLLKMDMSSGHGGKAGRYAQLLDLAWEYAFLLCVEGQRDV